MATVFRMVASCDRLGRSEVFCTAKLILYTKGVQMRQDIIVFST